MTVKYGFTLFVMLFLTAIAFSASPTEKLETSIDFEGDTVEGMNRMPLDSLNDFSEAEGWGNRGHLYRRNKKFNDETQELARDQQETY